MNIPANEMSDFLRKIKLSVTKERMELFRIVKSFRKSFGADEVVMEMRKSGCPISHSTFYRNINILKAAGLMEECANSGPLKRYIPSAPGKNIFKIRFLESGTEKKIHDRKFERNLKELCLKYKLRQDGIKVLIEGIGM